MQKTSVVILGSSGHAKVVFDVAIAAGFSVAAFEDPYTELTELFGVPIVKAVGAVSRPYLLVGGVGDNALRRRIVERALEADPTAKFAKLIHPSACISPSAQIGDGAVVMPGAIVNAGSTIGRHVILNTACSVDHDNHIGDFASFAPRSVSGGNVRVGEGASICIGSVISHGVAVGLDTVVGANSYVHRDLPPQTVAFGTPAKVVRSRKHGDRYL